MCFNVLIHGAQHGGGGGGGGGIGLLLLVLLLLMTVFTNGITFDGIADDSTTGYCYYC